MFGSLDVEEPEEGKRRKELDIDKSWQAIHYLLTGGVEGGEPPLAWVVFGATKLQQGASVYGTTLRMLSPMQVSSVAEALKEMTSDELLSRATIKVMNTKGVYSVGGRADLERKYIREHYSKLREYYRNAAANGNGMLIYIG
jgi:hypothetical protein